MTKYTANDFKNAQFATHPDGKIAARNWNDEHAPWWAQMPAGNYMGRSDYLMALDGWTPVQENPRPLTPDAITDEMVKRARVAWLGADINLTLDGSVREILTAALTEPPKRPEGAEEIEVLLFDAGVDENRAEVANYLAARLTDPTRKEA